jgi:hypothetical protein
MIYIEVFWIMTPYSLVNVYSPTRLYDNMKLNLVEFISILI